MGCLRLHRGAFNCWGDCGGCRLVAGNQAQSSSPVSLGLSSSLLPPSAPSWRVAAGAPKTKPRDKCLFGGISASLPPWAGRLENGIFVHGISRRAGQGPGRPPTLVWQPLPAVNLRVTRQLLRGCFAHGAVRSKAEWLPLGLPSRAFRCWGAGRCSTIPRLELSLSGENACCSLTPENGQRSWGPQRTGRISSGSWGTGR